MMTMVKPNFSRSSNKSFKMALVVFGSKADVASSQSKTFGFEAKALAIPTRCFDHLTAELGKH